MSSCNKLIAVTGAATAVARVLVLLLIVVFFLVSLAQAQPVLSKPNIIIIYADDLGYGDVSAYGMGILKTPNIDKIAKGGILFKKGYSSSATCSPSRYGLLTGRYPWRNKNG